MRADNSDPFDLFREKELDITLMKRPDDQVDALEQIEHCIDEEDLWAYLTDISKKEDKLHLLDDIDIIRAAVCVSPSAMDYASHRIRRDKHYILELLKLDIGWKSLTSWCRRFLNGKVHEASEMLQFYWRNLEWIQLSSISWRIASRLVDKRTNESSQII